MKRPDDWLVGVKQAARSVRLASSQARSHALAAFAAGIEASADALVEANQGDLADLPTGTSEAFRDRLALDQGRVAAMALATRNLASTPDPVGEVVEESRRPNGLLVKRVRSPLGVVFMVFESRPNVAADESPSVFARETRSCCAVVRSRRGRAGSSTA